MPFRKHILTGIVAHIILDLINDISVIDTVPGSIIGAGSVVTKDVPESAIMVGIPAKNIDTASSDKKFRPYGIAPGGDTKLDT